MKQQDFFIPEIIGHTKMSWYFEMFAVAERLVKEGKTFTSEDLTEIVGMPKSSGEVGAVMGGIVRKLKLKSHGRVASKVKSSHGAKLEVWGK